MPYCGRRTDPQILASHPTHCKRLATAIVNFVGNFTIAVTICAIAQFASNLTGLGTEESVAMRTVNQG